MFLGIHWAAWTIYVVIALWVAPAALHSWTALVLLTAWWLAELFTQTSGEVLPLGLYFLLDTLAFISVWQWRKTTDYPILGIYLGMWGIYASDLSPVNVWWSLWALQLAQFLLVGRLAYVLNVRGSIYGLVGMDSGQGALDGAGDIFGMAEREAGSARSAVSIDRKLEPSTRVDWKSR